MTQAILQLIEATTWVAVFGAFLWGVASVALSPCHLASVPLLVGFLGRMQGQTLSHRQLATWTTVGVSASLLGVAGVSLVAGRILGDLWGIGPWLMVGLLLGAGLLLLGVFELPSLGQLRPERARPGPPGAIAAGGVLGVTLGPCTFAFFAPLVAFGTGPAQMPLKVATLLAFVSAHLLATWSAGLFGARVGGWLSGAGRFARPLKGLVGLVAIGIALDMIVQAP